MPRPTEKPSDQHEAEKRGPKTGLSPSRHSTTSSVGNVPSPKRGPYPQTSDNDATSDVGLVDPSSHWKGKRTSVSNLAKDWKDELTECELQALQYKVSLNGVKEEIRHVLDSEMAKRDGHLTLQQMYEAVKRYETYVAQNKRLDGKGTNTSAGQQKTTGQSPGYKPQFHKTTTFVATAGGPDDEADHPQGSSPYEDSGSHEVEPPPKEDEGLYIPSYLKEAIPDDPVLQVKVARALRVKEMNSRRCFTCNRPGHLTQDHQEWEEKNGIRPSSRRGLLQTKRPQRRLTKTLPARTARASHGVERVPYLNPDAFSRFIGPRNWGQALINDELTTCLLDNGAQLNFITPAYTVERVWTLCPQTGWLKRLEDHFPSLLVWAVAWWSLPDLF